MKTKKTKKISEFIRDVSVGYCLVFLIWIMLFCEFVYWIGNDLSNKMMKGFN